MKEVANTFDDADLGHRVELWNRSKVRQGRKEAGGEGSSLKPVSCLGPPYTSRFPHSLPTLLLSLFWL